MDFRDQVFISVAEHLSFSRAAEVLYISQPAVSKHIQQLEESYGVELFERKGNKIILTQSGKTLYNGLRKVQLLYREIEINIGQLKDQIEGELIIGASSTISQYVIPKVIASFHRLYPSINIYLVSGNSFEMEQALIDHKLDIALVENEAQRAGIRYSPFLSDELIVVSGANSVFSKRKAVKISELIDIPIVLREQGSGTLDVVLQALKKQKISENELNTFIHLGSTESIKNFLMDFDGIAIISERAATQEFLSKKLVKIHVDGFTIPRMFRVAQGIGKRSHIAEMFEQFLKTYEY